MGVATVTLNQQQWAYVCVMLERAAEDRSQGWNLIAQIKEQAFAEQSEPVYEYGTRWNMPKSTSYPAHIQDFSEESREEAERIIREDQELTGSPEPRGSLIRRQAAGPWEVVK